MATLVRRFGLPGIVLLIVLLLGTRLQTTTPSAALGPIQINEIESNGGTPGDWVELFNTSGAPVDVSGYKFIDGDPTHTMYSIPVGTVIPAGGYLVLEESQFGFGLGTPDSANLYAADGTTLLDTFAWTPHATTSYGRCPNGTGAFTTTGASTKGGTNNCNPPGAPPSAGNPWPGDATITTVDPPNVLGGNMSGLTYEAAAPGVLWAVKNGPGTLYRLIPGGAQWVPDPAWAAAGKLLRFTNGAGDVDAEGLTFGPGSSVAGIYVGSERNNSANTVSRNSILLFDPALPGPITASREWNLTADLPATGPNLGIEAITFIPDAHLTGGGFVDQSKGRRYNPNDYPSHNGGLIFVGVEQNGVIYAYALNHTDSTFTRIATIPTGFSGVMGLEFDRALNILWAVCDDTCGGQHAVLQIGSTGAIAVQAVFARPAAMPNINNEGFAVGAQAQCTGGMKPAWWADDANTGGNAIRQGTVPCSTAFLLSGAATGPGVSPTATSVPGAPTPVVPVIPPFPLVFQNPAAILAVHGGIGNGTRNNTPVPARPTAVVPSTGIAPAVMPAISPPSTGDAALLVLPG